MELSRKMNKHLVAVSFDGEQNTRKKRAMKICYRELKKEFKVIRLDNANMLLLLKKP